jgi:hypothetical protein
MIALVCLIWSGLIGPFKSRSRLEVENAALRHQVVVLRRKVRGRVEFTNGDRLFFILLYRWSWSALKAMLIVRPETVVRWHRAGFRRYWRWKSQSRGGRPPISVELRALIRRMSVENVLWGAPRIQGELLKIGFTVAQSTVAKYMAKRRSVRPELEHVPAQSCAADCSNGFVRGSDHRLCSALRPGNRSAGSARACLDQCNKTPNGGVGHAADHRSLPMEPSPTLSDPRPIWDLRCGCQASASSFRHTQETKDEVLLTATAQNLRRLVKFLCSPPPSAAFTCAA